MNLSLPFSTMRESCYATLSFFDIFDYPLTLNEINCYFLGKRAEPGVLGSFLAGQSAIETKDGFYFLRNRAGIIQSRKRNNDLSKKYWNKVKRFMPFIQMVPFVQMVAVCNTLAFNNASKASDIDLFIVAKKNRLFIVRFFSLVVFLILGIRRHHKKIAGRFCLSFYLSDDALDLKSIQLGVDDIYLPYWLLSLKPVYGLETYRKLLAMNSWSDLYFQRKIPENTEFLLADKGFRKNIGSLFELFLRGKFGDFLEHKLAKIQFARHKKNISKIGAGASIVVSHKMLKFHNIDRRSEFNNAFYDRFRNLMTAENSVTK